MIRILAINSGIIGSTGNIMTSIAERGRLKGLVYYTSSPGSISVINKKIENHIFIGNPITRNIHIFLGKVLSIQGIFSVLDTLCFLFKVNRINPDIIHLHNMHNCYINLPILYGYIKKRKIPVVWTLHDCWAFTGQCPHFTLIKCNKWKTGCYECPQYRDYPATVFDGAKIMWKIKKKCFSDIEGMMLVTPSKWLAALVEDSFLGKYEVKVINNGINLEVFRPIKSEFRQIYNINKEKYILLGVAFDWGEKKGLDVFIELSKRLDSNKYQIVLVGTNERIDGKLPSNIISIHRTQNQQELAKIYTVADVFVNPTREEVLGLVNIEANACGTPVITFKTGGSPECISIKSGVVVDCDDIDAMQQEIVRICNEKPFSELDCINRAKEFDRNKRFEEYVQLYEEIYN